MKKLLNYILFIMFIGLAIWGIGSLDKFQVLSKTSFETIRTSNTSDYVKDISNKLVRFHVIANSDSDEDQRVKLRVRDEILNKFGPELSKCENREESITFLNKNLRNIEGIADKILMSEGKSYRTIAMLGRFNFPVKSYGSITLPSGEYTALRVVLGEGGGRNWWCVMFPPLCFIDITRGVASDDTNNQLKRALSSKEIRAITTFNQNETSKGSKSDLLKATTLDMKNKSYSGQMMKPSVELRFKSLDFIKNLLNRK